MSVYFSYTQHLSHRQPPRIATVTLRAAKTENCGNQITTLTMAFNPDIAQKLSALAGTRYHSPCLQQSPPHQVIWQSNRVLQNNH